MDRVQLTTWISRVIMEPATILQRYETYHYFVTLFYSLYFVTLFLALEFYIPVYAKDVTVGWLDGV